MKEIVYLIHIKSLVVTTFEIVKNSIYLLKLNKYLYKI